MTLVPRIVPRIVPRRLRLLAAILLASLSALPLGVARAQGAPAANPALTDGSARATLLAERQRVRAQLDRINHEVEALKQNDRGMRDDYRLRARLADAEALARRLTEIDAQLGTKPAGPGTRPPALGAEPVVTASDGPAEMEAKADILADQARRIASEAQGVRQRALDLRARQDLRRRVGQMEHDPFSPLEGSKRRVAATAPSGTGAPRLGDAAKENAFPTNAPPPSSPAVTGATDAPGSGSTFTPGRGPAAAGTSGGGITGPAAPPLPTSGPSAAGGSSLSPQLRDLLDPATLGEVRRLESSGVPGANIEALERAAAALRARAEKLQSQSQSLRARARQPR